MQHDDDEEPGGRETMGSLMRAAARQKRSARASVPPVPSEDDAQLFRDAIGPVRRLKEDAAAAPTAPRPAPEPVQAMLDEAHVIDELLTHPLDASIEGGDEITYLKPGQQHRLLQRLRRGQFSVQAEIDLHDMTSTVAREAIRHFLDDSRRDGALCVRIVHGKGLRSKAQGPVLKQLTDTLLRRRADVLAFTSARPAQGGTGAVIVLLQAR